MERLDEAARVSDDDLRRLFSTVVMKVPLEASRRSLHGGVSTARHFEIFEFIHGRPYESTNERTPIDLDACVTTPYAYATQSAETVGNQLMGIGHLIKTMALRAEHQVLELGSGWGNVALPLAQVGHAVTAIDIDPNMVELVRERARRLGVSIDARV